MSTVTISRTEQRLIAVKQVSSERAAELDREARLLQSLQHPGVVQFIELDESGDGGRILRTGFVSSDTWVTRPLLDSGQRTAAVAALAAVLADLHDLGITHRGLSPCHVLHGPDDRPILCSFSRSREASPEYRREDLQALGDLMYDDGVKGEPLAGRLAALAETTRAGKLSAREVARRADHLSASGSASRRDRRSGSRPEPGLTSTGGQRRRRLAVMTAAAGLILIVTFIATSARLGSDLEVPTGEFPLTSDSHDLVVPQATPASGSDASPVDSSASTVDSSASTVESPVNSTKTRSGSSDISGTGRPEPAPAGSTPDAAIDTASDTTIDAATDAVTDTGSAPGVIVKHGGRSYSIGLQDDLVVLGDWDCDGEVTPAIVRPATGGVVLFESWPGVAETIEAPIRWQVDGPNDLKVESVGACDRLRVYTAIGSLLLDPRETP